MAGSRTPGPTGTDTHPGNIDAGTLARTASPVPGAVCATAYGRDEAGYVDRAKCLVEAYLLALVLAPSAIYRETGYRLSEIRQAFLPGLLQALAIVGASSTLGAGIGAIVGMAFGGVGAAPGAVVGTQLGFDAGSAVLAWLGLAFLAEALLGGMAELQLHLSDAVHRAWHAADCGSLRRPSEIRAAATELAHSAAILLRLILQGIVAYLLKQAGLGATRGTLSTAQIMRQAGARAAAEDAVSGLVAKLRGSRLSSGFADWVANNWEDLMRNPRLRPRRMATAAEEVVESKAVTPSRAKSQRDTQHDTNTKRKQTEKTDAPSSKGQHLAFQPSSGVELKSTPGKTTTILGNYRQDMKYIVDELGNIKSVDFGHRVNDFNVLNVPDELYRTPKQFWEEYNKPWLSNTISRGDTILMATEPQFGAESPLFRLNQQTGKLELSGFGKEYSFLRQNSYTYDHLTKQMLLKP